MITLNPKIAGLRPKGVLQSLYIRFREEKARETIEFSFDGNTVLVDAGADNYPVGAQIIFAEGVKADSRSRESADSDKDGVRDVLNLLFLFATEMMRFHAFNQQKLGNSLIQETVEQIRKIPPDQIKEASL